MAKCILMSIKPKYVSLILNKAKTLEIRKRFPSDYVGWVYIYCTKDKSLVKVGGRYLHLRNSFAKKFSEYQNMSGKVVARFWCDKVGNFSKEIFGTYEEPFTYNQDDLLKKSCLTEKELDDYLQGKNGHAIHIKPNTLKIFDKPKEISEFHKVGYQEELKELQAEMEEFEGIWDTSKYYENFRKKFQLTRAPQSFCFIEIGE